VGGGWGTDWEWRYKEGLGAAARSGQGDRRFRGEGRRLRGEREEVERLRDGSLRQREYGTGVES
jgi:hypothetical protein